MTEDYKSAVGRLYRLAYKLQEGAVGLLAVTACQSIVAGKIAEGKGTKKALATAKRLATDASNRRREIGELMQELTGVVAALEVAAEGDGGGYPTH